MKKLTFNESNQQGDVVLTPVSDIPADAVEVKNFNGVVQEGEMTGHAHRFAPDSGARMFESPSTGKRYLKLVRPSALSHEEHHTQEIPAKTFEVGIVRETDWLTRTIRRVAD